jgi:two-component system, cell cycle response regulator
VPASFGARSSDAPKLRVLGPVNEQAQQAASSTPGGRARSAEALKRLGRLAAELDLLEVLPFSNADAAFAPAVAAERRAKSLGDDHLIKRAQLVQADVLGRKGKHTASGQLIREVLEWAREHDDTHVLARSHRLLSMFFDAIRDVPSAWEHALRAVELLDDSMSERLRADHLIGLGVALVRTGAYDGARERYRAALQLAEGLDDAPLRVKILNNLAWLEADAGDAHQSMAIARRMLAFGYRHNVPLDAACLDTIAHAQLMLGRYTEAEATLRPILDDADLSSRESEGLAEALNTAAQAQRLQGHPERAQVTVTRCLELCDERGFGAIRVEALEEQACIYAAQRRFRKAYEQHIEFHKADIDLRAAQREASARTLHAVFESAEARRDGERFRELALRDELTGLRNRRLVETDLPRLLNAAAEEELPIAIALVDLDHFKLVNDLHSHAIGDTVLRQVSAVLAASTAEAGWAARLGGDEFLLVFPGSTIADAMLRIEELRQAIETHDWEAVSHGLAVTVSIGVTAQHPGRTTQSAILGQADRNLYAAKDAGRNRVVGDPAS